MTKSLKDKEFQWTNSYDCVTIKQTMTNTLRSSIKENEKKKKNPALYTTLLQFPVLLRNLELYYNRDRRSLVVSIITTDKHNLRHWLYRCGLVSRLLHWKITDKQQLQRKKPKSKRALFFLLLIPLICAISSPSFSYCCSPFLLFSFSFLVFFYIIDRWCILLRFLHSIDYEHVV